MHLDVEVTRFIGGAKTLEQTRERLEQWLAEYERYGSNAFGCQECWFHAFALLSAQKIYLSGRPLQDRESFGGAQTEICLV
jgi:hypothetical protein